MNKISRLETMVPLVWLYAVIQKITDRPVPILNTADYCTPPWTYTNGSAAAGILNDISQLENVRSKLRGSSYIKHTGFESRLRSQLY
jgi:hypothetical protein